MAKKFRCNKCHRAMNGTTAYDGACWCGGLIEVDPTWLHVVKIEDAPKIWDWIHNRGGIAIWKSINLSNWGASWTTPCMNETRDSMTEKPNWQCSNVPDRIIVDPTEIIVSRDKEVKRFHVGVRVSGNGLMLKVTDGGTRRIRNAVAKAGEGAYHVFDYMTQEAIIMAPNEQMSMADWYDYFCKEDR